MEMKSFDFVVPVLSKTTMKWHQQQKKQTNNFRGIQTRSFGEEFSTCTTEIISFNF